MTVARLSLALAALIAAGEARTADQVVTNCANDAELRADIVAMQATGGGTLTFACAASPALIVLTATLPTISTATTIDGGNVVSVSGGNGFRHFVVAGSGTLALRRITLRNGLATTDGGSIASSGSLLVEDARFEANQSTTQSGGAIIATGPTTIRRSTFVGNRAVNGAAFYPRFSTAVTTIEDSRFEDNRVSLEANTLGGAILAWDGAPLTVTRTVFEANEGALGGAIYVTPNSRLTMTDSTLRANNALSGGAIVNAGATRLERVTVAGNTANIGSAMRNDGALELVNATLSGNLDPTGGALRNFGNATIQNTTFALNSSGAIFVQSGSVTVRNTVIQGLCGSGPSVSLGFNLASGACSWMTATGDRQNTDAGLGPLGDHGGPTLTHLPAASSPLVDQGTVAGCPATDQRGIARPIGVTCDIGSVERPEGLFADGFE